jgi:hypothetical protein
MSKEEINAIRDKQLSESKDVKHVTFSLEEMLEIAQYGFDLAKNSSETYVPIGNMLQHIMTNRDMIIVPDAWIDFKHNGITNLKSKDKE